MKSGVSHHSHGKTKKLSRSLSLGELTNVIDNIGVLSDALTWVQKYLGCPHADLGRPGAVCPFVPTALAQDTLHIAIVRLKPDDKRAQIVNAVNLHLQAFTARAQAAGEPVLHATLILFPDVSSEEAPELIDRTKEELKPAFIERGLMLGEFHSRNESPGLHNPEFKPLRCPVPLLAIRHMVASDLAFLNRPEYEAGTRLRYLEAYLAMPDIPLRNRKEAEDAMTLLRDQLQDRGALVGCSSPDALAFGL